MDKKGYMLSHDLPGLNEGENRLLREVFGAIVKRLAKEEQVRPVVYLADEENGIVQEGDIFSNAGPKETGDFMRLLRNLIRDKDPDMFIVAMEVWSLHPDKLDTYVPGEDLSKNPNRISVVIFMVGTKGGVQWAGMAKHDPVGKMGPVYWTKNLEGHPLAGILDERPDWVEIHKQTTTVEQSEEP